MFVFHSVLAVVLAAVANMIVGWLWYGYWAHTWVKLQARPMTKAQMQQDAVPAHVAAAIGSLVLSFTIGGMLFALEIKTVGEAMWLGVWLWFGLLAFPFLNNYLFSKRPLALWAIDCGYYLVTFPLMAAIHAYLAS